MSTWLAAAAISAAMTLYEDYRLLDDYVGKAYRYYVSVSMLLSDDVQVTPHRPTNTPTPQPLANVRGEATTDHGEPITQGKGLCLLPAPYIQYRGVVMGAQNDSA